MARLKHVNAEKIYSLIKGDAEAQQAWTKLQEACGHTPGGVEGLRILLCHVARALEEQTAPARRRAARGRLKSLPNRMRAMADDVKGVLRQLGLEHLGAPLREWRNLADLLQLTVSFSSPPRPVHAAVVMFLRSVRAACGKPFYREVGNLLTPIFRSTGAEGLADRMLNTGALGKLASRTDQALARLSRPVSPYDAQSMSAIREAERKGLAKLRAERRALLKKVDPEAKASH